MTAFRVYEPHECGADGYPLAWHDLGDGKGVKHLVREQAGHRCVRCHHPYECGVSGGQWTPCDWRCNHPGPIRAQGEFVEASWRILTVHHLRLGNDAKRDLRWWNLAALCQRCHLQIQGKVVMERVWPWPHSEWFKPYAAGWYAWSYLGEDLTREQTLERLNDLLALEQVTSHPSVRVCATCGHLEADHKSNMSPTRPRAGICLRDGCPCREFRDQFEADLDALSRAALTPYPPKDTAA